MALQRVRCIRSSLVKLAYPMSHLPSALSGPPMPVTSFPPRLTSRCDQGPPLHCGTCLLHTSSRLTAGHSKWQNIRHIKAANDQIKSLNALTLVKKIGVCLNKNPSLDLNLNSELASLKKWAQSMNIPNDTFNRQIEKAKQLKDPKNIVTLDGQGLQGTGIIIECFTLNKKHTQNILQSLMKKGGFSLHMEGAHLFQHRGLVEVVLPEVDLPSAVSDLDGFNLDKYVDIAIEAEAEDVTLEQGEEKPHLCFSCGPFDLTKVQRGLEEAGLEVISAERTYTAKETVTISRDHWELIEKVIVKMDDIPEIVKYHFNFVVDDEESS